MPLRTISPLALLAAISAPAAAQEPQPPTEAAAVASPASPAAAQAAPTTPPPAKTDPSATVDPPEKTDAPEKTDPPATVAPPEKSDPPAAVDPPAKTDPPAPAEPPKAPAEARDPMRPIPPVPIEMRMKKAGCCGPGPRVGGRIQIWAIPLLGDDAKVADLDPANAEGFRLRRARLDVDGQLVRTVPYGLQVELADQVTGRTGLLDAWLAWKPDDALGFTLGVHKVPFAAGNEVSSAKLQLPDRPLTIQTLADFRELGVSVGGEVFDGMIGYDVGAFNGSFGQFTRGDDNPGLLFAGRLEAGFGDIGETEADLEGGGPRVRLGGGAFHNDSSTVVQRGWTADLRAKLAGVSLVVAYLQDHTEPIERPTAAIAVDAGVDRSATYAQLGLAVGPLAGLALLRGLEVAGRFELLDDNHALTDGGDALLATGAVSWYFADPRLKLQAAYTRKHERHGPAVDNDALVLSTLVRF